MKILHITINPIALERRILNQARTTHDVRILALKNADSDKKKSISPVILTELTTIFHHGGPLKFLHYNLKVANSGRKIDTDLIHAHDLWVLPAAVLLAKIKKIPLIYDAHEFYNGLEIFIRRKIRRFIWLQVEKWCIPKIDYLITVSEPLAQLYRDRFNPGCPVQVIRNLPVFETVSLEKQMPLIRREGERLILFHGHFRPGRGLMSLISALAKIPHCRLALIGGGEMSDELKALARETGVIDRVDFYDYISTDRLISTAAQADLAVVLFEPTSENYANALPNKFFEYLMAGLPVLTSNIGTFTEYVAQYKVGRTVDPANVEQIAVILSDMISDQKLLEEWHKNALLAARELNWDNESQKMHAIYDDLGKK